MNFQYPLKGHQFLQAPVERGQVRDSQAYHPGGLLQGISPTNPTPRLWTNEKIPPKKTSQETSVSN